MPAKNIKTDYGAIGDGTLVTRTVTISAGSPNLSATADTWTVGDVGKTIHVQGAGGAIGIGFLPLISTIGTVTDARNVVLANNAGRTLSAASVFLAWGTNDAPAFLNFRTFGRAQSDLVTLTIPAGIYITGRQTGNTETSPMRPFDGIPQLSVIATGATMLSGATTAADGLASGGGLRLTTMAGFTQSANTSARVQTVEPGATSLTCVTASQAGRFTVGRWVALTALEFQGASGFPPNHHYVQFVQILSVDAGTGIVTFAPAAKQRYSSTYPQTNPAAAYDTGGPATLFPMTLGANETADGGVVTAWDTDVTVDGLTIVSTFSDTETGAIVCPGRSVVVKNCTFTNCAPCPSTNKYNLHQNCTAPDSRIEIDKECEYIEYRNCALRSIDIQSSSVDVVFDNTSVSNFLHGTSRNTVFRNGCAITDFQLGVLGYGTSESVEARDSTFTAITGVTFVRTDATNFTESGGNITYSGSGILSFGADGSQLFLAGQKSGGGSYVHVGFPTWISRITDASNEPKLWTRFPTLAPSFLAGNPIYVVQHPCRSVSFYNCSGCVEAVDLSAAPKGKPLYSYCNRTGSFATLVDITMWGYLKSLKINVLTPGDQTNCRLHVGGFDNRAYIDTDGISFKSDFAPIINCKIAGLRTITPTSISGAQSGDTLGKGDNVTPWGKIWFISDIAPWIQDDISTGQTPSINIEMETDQFQMVGRLR